MKKVLIVDDDPHAHILIQYDLIQRGDEVFMASNGEEGLSLFKQEQPEIVISDTNMPKMNGPDMVKQILRINPQVKIITCSEHLRATPPFPENLPFFQKPLRFNKIAQLI